MFLWLLRTGRGGYDSNDGVVVCADDEMAARAAMRDADQCGDECPSAYGHECTWRNPLLSSCVRIGIALHTPDNQWPGGIVLRSFNAG